MKSVIIFLLSCTIVNANVPLVTFDENPGTTFNFTEQGSPTTGTWEVTDGHGVMEGEIRVDWDIHYEHFGWPGFIRATAKGDFIDASTVGAATGSLILMVRSTTPEYTGFRVSFASTEKWKTTTEACSDDLGPFKNRGCYIASFTVPAGRHFVPVRIPFSSFSGKWLYSSGEQWKTCAEDKDACPTAKTLAKIQQIDLWAKGVKGKAHLEVKSIAVVGEESKPSGIDYVQSAVV